MTTDDATAPDTLLEAALTTASAVQAEARRLPAWVRIQALTAAADRVADDAEAFAHQIATEGVKTIREARREVTRCVETLRLSADECRRAGEVIAFDQTPQGAGRFGWWTRRPLGVVLAITPYNDPLNLVAHKLGPAVAAGAPILIKPHPATPASAYRLCSVFAGRGLPAGMIQVIVGDGNLACRAAADPRVAVVSFTGGRAAGADLAAAAAGKGLLLEMGGAAVAVVDDGVDLERAAEALVSGAFWAAGQNCVHTQHVIVGAASFVGLVSRMTHRALRLVQGSQLDPATDVGPMLTEADAILLEGLVDDACRRGARRLCGGKRRGRWFEPTLLADMPRGHPLLEAEVFGPVTTVERVADFDAALKAATARGPAINAALFSDRLSHILAFQDIVEAGAVIINDSTDFRIDAMPFGGDGAAGLGREGVRWAVEAYTRPRVVCLRP